MRDERPPDRTPAIALTLATAQSLGLDLGGGGSATGRILQIVTLITVLSVAPAILIMVTSFTRIVVVLSFLRSALGTQQTQPNMMMVRFYLFLTAFIMAPVMKKSYHDSIAPLMEERFEGNEAFNRSARPWPNSFSARCVSRTCGRSTILPRRRPRQPP